ncbi:MAG: 30S ribosomal protein S17 [Candidatus Liptonbacteria bacterium RIFCSPLOWO2_01_FULL_56_20]|uniref:Small ribosomal subunit protein uS17 n=1 Tax=Candidatus Liptonbacteria bacterium RIFCSPLOWO2_01_FULL_56_20 TaxID=1798652 RepID=A0A1G2CJI8_9BACT|nr:MAG: 30S ribosomal protein S17 [Candidatus Liptonbacteria bacterium RIFCSPHIGHO2_01_FULL_56_18b]OGZ01564.1 MAG: 30S ribosomal protein S17 [Candidatus Liptonbacteria bacterium RIFCSPLOWO2_01_FULL_56_20]
MTQNQKAAAKRRLVGTVVSERMQKTRVIAITRLKQHPKYLLRYKVTRKFHAHDERNEYHVGDRVVIEETRPLSKTKRWSITGKA